MKQMWLSLNDWFEKSKLKKEERSLFVDAFRKASPEVALNLIEDAIANEWPADYMLLEMNQREIGPGMALPEPQKVALKPQSEPEDSGEDTPEFEVLDGGPEAETNTPVVRQRAEKPPKKGLKLPFWGKIKGLVMKSEPKPESISKNPGKRGSNIMSKLPSNKTMLIATAIGVLILIVGVAGFWTFGLRNANTPPDPYYDFGAVDIPTDEPDISPSIQNLDENREVRPELTNPKPLDFASSAWLKSVQFLSLAEFLGIMVFLIGDALYRKQVVDAIVAVLMMTLTVFFLPAGTSFILAIVLLLFEIGIVVLVSFLSGRDFTPIGSYFVLTALVGGLFFSKIAVIQAIFGVTSSPVLPLNQLGILFAQQNWAALHFPLIVYSCFLIGLGFLVWDVFRPSEDDNSRWGTVIAAVASFVIYILLLQLAGLDAWVSYLVAVSLSIGISTFFQKERKVQTVTLKWGTRSPFDASAVITAILLLIQISTGAVMFF